MKRREFLKNSAMTAAAVITPWGIIQSKSHLQPEGTLETAFMTPPASAKPHTWWHWMNGNVTKEGITLDLEAMARVGIGGFQNFDAGTGIPKGPIVYLSPEWLELKKHAIAEAQRLGLEFTMHNCPGWSSSGGPWITPELAMQELKFSEITIEGGKQVNVKLPKPETKLDHYKDICVLAFPSVNGKVDGWEKRANFAFNRNGVDDIPANTPAIPEIDILDVTQHLQPDGQFVWGPYSRGQWTIVRFGYGAIGTENRSAPDTGVGLECDKYNATAFEFHFNKMMENLLPFLQPLGKNGKVGLLIDSYEVGMQNWTPGFEKIFKEKNGYDMLKYLPAMTGRVVGNADLTNRFLWDLRRTQGTLMADNYYGKFTELCHKNNIISYIQPYDRGPMEEMQIGARIDINVGEFWQNLSSIFQNNLTMRRTVKLSAAIAHTNGQKVVAAEAFTSEPESGKWQEHPFSLKVQGDRMFTQGLNRMVFHRFAHQPHPTAKPGMTMGPWGSHFDRTNTWWEQGKAWITYLSRCQYLLQSGTFVADIAYFTGEDAGVYTRVERHELMPAPPEGIDYDLINSETLLNKAKVIDRQLVLDSGMSYKVLSIQDFKTMTEKVLRKIVEFKEKGLTIIGQKPLRTPGLTNDDKWFEETVTDLQLDNVDLNSLKKDFSFTSQSGDAPITWIHRKIEDADVYFLANQRRTPESLVCHFRVPNKRPEIWDPITGKIYESQIYDVKDDTMTVPLRMDPSGSLFVIFRKQAENNPVVSIRHNSGYAVQTEDYDVRRELKADDHTNFISPAFVVTPENSIMLSTKNFMDGQLPWTDWYAEYPVGGEKLFGKGHATLGFTVGRNGIAVWENSTGRPEFNFSVEMPISRVRVQLQCKDGVPSVLINDEIIKEGVKSKYIVHPSPGLKYLSEGASFFNGDIHTKDEITNEEPILNYGNEILATARGEYWVKRKNNKTTHLDFPRNIFYDISSDWKVEFPDNSGAPASINLEDLTSLSDSEIPGVKYFSGTCTYTRNFRGFKKAKKSKSRYFVKIRDVKVMAEISINNIPLGMFWTPPLIIDMTDHILEGNNTLVIKVTNLWPNRLIGDEQQPPVYKYAPGAGGKGFASLSGGAIQELPEWYKKNEPKPNDGRVTFATWQHYTKESPLLESGLIGPVTISEGAIL